MVSAPNLHPNTDLLLYGPSSSLQGADSRDLQMNQALRFLENEHQELQAKIECLQGDRDLCSLDTQDLQGTLLLGGFGRMGAMAKWAKKKETELRERLQPFICLLDWLIGFVISFHLEGEAGLF